jgi:colanic acid biosynthesis glycosyl transferase WcaI
VVAESENAELRWLQAAEALQNLSLTERQRMGAKAQTYYREHLALAVGVSQFGKIFNTFGRKK